MRWTGTVGRTIGALGVGATLLMGAAQGVAAQATPEAGETANCIAPLPSGGMHPYAFPQPEDRSEGFWSVIEVPSGSFTKYEIHGETGEVIVDRFVTMSVEYPANYGSIPQSAGGDGDPLDLLVLTRTPLDPGVFIQVRAIGILKMIDDGEVDDKLVAVPVSSVDPTYDDILSIEDLPLIERQRIEGFFDVYKQLPEGSDAVELDGFEGVEAAETMVDEAIGLYQSSC